LTLQGGASWTLPNFEVDQSTVSRDLKAIQRQWKESAIRDFDLIGNRNYSVAVMLRRNNIGSGAVAAAETSLMRDLLQVKMNWEIL